MPTSWPKRPVIYEINTWVWLNTLRQQYKRDTIMLDSVPEEQWDELASLGVDAVWLMGVWSRSPRGREMAIENMSMAAEFHTALPDYNPAIDNIGSAYCIHGYEVDQRLGGSEGLKIAREQLKQRNIRLILDFVPNHVAQDHEWVSEHPEYFVRGTQEDLRQEPTRFFQADQNVIARGAAKSNNSEVWSDVAQLNAFSLAYRRASIETLHAIAEQCDGVRCDMAMLLLNSVLGDTWGRYVSQHPPAEYWRVVISSIRAQHPELLFMAEVYWDREWELLQLGFDYCYDKERFYDRLRYADAEGLRLHLSASLAYQDKLVRFIENHDEQRAAVAFSSPEKERMAAVMMMTVPGAKLLHDGQCEGYKLHTPVMLARRQHETPDLNLQDFYHKLLTQVRHSGLSEATWQLCECQGWPDNSTYLNLLAWCWSWHEQHYLVVANLSPNRSQGRIRLPWGQLTGGTWCLRDLLSDRVFEQGGHELEEMGLFVELRGWGVYFLGLQAEG